MHRWQLQRFVRVLAPVLLYLALLCLVIVGTRAAAGGRGFLADEAYGHVAVARNISQSGVYGLARDARMPATRDVLWRLALAAVTRLTGDAMSAPYVVGALCGVVTLLLLLRMARLLFPFPPFVLYAAALLVLAPGFVLESVSGTSASLATCLVTAACLQHIEGLSGRSVVLPVTVPLLVGLACWLRIEFVLVWAVLSLHAWLLALMPGQQTSPYGATFVVVRSVIGWLILALMLLPVFAWNAVLLRVPWPRMPGVPLSLDVWALGAPDALRRSLALSGGAFGRLFAALRWPAFLQSGVAWWLFLMGLVVLVGLAAGRDEERPFTLLAILPLALPPLYALAYPYTGGGAVGALYGALTPLAAVVVAFGFFRVPFLVEGLYRKWKRGIPAAIGFQTWWIGVGSLILALSVYRSFRLVRAECADLARETTARTALSETIRNSGLAEVTWVTDRPGWLSYAYGPKLIDLNGEGSSEVLVNLAPNGSLDPARLGRLLQERRPGALLLGGNERRFVESLVRGRLLYPPPGEEGGGTRLLAVTWTSGL